MKNVPPIKTISRSLIDLIGAPYLQAVCSSKAILDGDAIQNHWAIAGEKVDFFPSAFQSRLDKLLDSIGDQVCEPLTASSMGSGTAAFTKATHIQSAPLSGAGFIRIGEDGRVYLVSKSEHYHASLGHSFPGYRLVENARKLGIPNATHNNTRGYITRRLEEELVRVSNGISRNDDLGLQSIIRSTDSHVLNRVINLETGSLAVEAAFKMMMARFFPLEDTSIKPQYFNRTPVFLVMADNLGGKKANYHGTTMFTQFLRGMWSTLYDRLESNQILVVKPVKINDQDHFNHLVNEFDQPPYKIAGFFHEIILMNYGAIRISEDFLQNAYALCQQHDIPTMVDEIQSCIWSPEFFLFREYGLQPDFVSIGKGFPGGEYPASRILTTPAMDNLNQFGALVTNGQEELSSLAYLVTMEFVHANRDYIANLGDYYENELDHLQNQYSSIISKIEGYRHLSSICFHRVDQALQFIDFLNRAGIDISAQTYKADCPPAALTKIPLISSPKMVDFLIFKMKQALTTISA